MAAATAGGPGLDVVEAKVIGNIGSLPVTFAVKLPGSARMRDLRAKLDESLGVHNVSYGLFPRDAYSSGSEERTPASSELIATFVNPRTGVAHFRVIIQ